MAALGYVNTRGDKLRSRSNAVCIGLPPAPRYSPFTSVCKSSHTTWVHRRPASCARSAQIFSGKNKNKKNMKDHLGYGQPMPLFSYVYSRLALGLLTSSIRCKKPIHSLQLFFAVAVWLVSPKRRNTLR